MKRILIAAVLLGFAGAARAEINFDQGVDVKAAIEQASEVSADLPVADRYLGHSRYTRDCVRFGFGPSDAAQTSERVWLRSQEYIQDCHTQYVQQCHTVTGPNGKPQTQCVTRPVTHCYERPGQTWREAVQVKVEARKLFPWERDSVEVCLEGPWSRLYVNQAAYKYSVSKTGNYDTLYALTPGKKVAMAPDENGIEMTEFSYKNGKYTFKVSDKWAKEYAGEKVAIKVDLYREVTFWPDSYKGGKEFVFDAAHGYTMTFTEKDLQKAVADDSYRGPKKFYLKWGFKRLGDISTDKFVKKDKSVAVEIDSKGEVSFLPVSREVSFGAPAKKNYGFLDCWTGNEYHIGEYLCRLTCCLASPDNMHSPAGQPNEPKVTCHEDCQDGITDNQNNNRI